MQAALKLKTTVLPGHRVEFTAPELPEGTRVELIVLPDLPAPETARYIAALDYLDTLPPSPLTMEDWERIEKEIQKEKDSWER